MPVTTFNIMFHKAFDVSLIQREVAVGGRRRCGDRATPKITTSLTAHQHPEEDTSLVHINYATCQC